MGKQHTYLDASALMRKAEGVVQGCSPRNSLIQPIIDGILHDSSRIIACSEITLMEFHSNLTTNWRSTDAPHYDRAWWEASRSFVLGLIESGQIAVLPSPPQMMEQAMALVTMATRDFVSPVRSWDAIHMMVANQWAFSENSLVEIVTSDAHFDFVDVFQGFSPRLRVLNLDVAAGTGEGADRA